MPFADPQFILVTLAAAIALGVLWRSLGRRRGGRRGAAGCATGCGDCGAARREGLPTRPGAGTPDSPRQDTPPAAAGPSGSGR